MQAEAPPIDPTARPAERSRRKIRWLTLLTSAWCLAPIAVVALALRFAGIGWGGNYYTHPDELFMTMVAVEISGPGSLGGYLDTATSPLNPYNGRFDSYVYGTFPLFAAKLLGEITGNDVFGNGHLPGRWLSAIADTGSVLLVYVIGRRLFGRLAGTLGAVLLAFTMLHIQASHFFTTDAMSAFLATATFALILYAGDRRGFALYAAAGLAAGLAAASKPNLLLAFALLALPLLEAVRIGGWRSVVPGPSNFFGREEHQKTSLVLPATVLAGFVAIWTFRFAQPYAFADSTPFSFRLNPQWTTDLSFWQRAQAGTVDLPPSIQWAERAPVVFIVDNMIRWGMGPGMGIAALAGLALVLWRIVSSRGWPSWWLVGIAGWVLFHILFFGTGLGKAQRYLLPAYPLLAVLAGLALDRLIAWARLSGWGVPRVPRPLHPGYLLPAIVVVSTILYGLAFTTIFTREHTRVDASEWIFANVPPGSSIASEYWDFALPVALPGEDIGQYQSFPLDLYKTDSAEKLSTLIGQLNRTDYIVLSSNRLFESIPRMPWRYPMTTAYYEALFSGELGFERVAHFTSFPELFGVALDDRGAEESLTVYDHPEVQIFRKSAAWSDDAAWYLLNDALGRGGIPLLPAQTQPDRMMLDEGERLTLAQTGTPAGIPGVSALVDRAPALFWYVAFQLMTLPAIPILWRILPNMPDRGYALAKTLGVAGVGWLAWLVTTTSPLSFGTMPMLIAWLALLGPGALAVRSDLRGFRTDLRQRRAWIVATELLFGVVFVLATGVRTLGSDRLSLDSGRSSPLDLGVLTATIRTPEFPPYDPWLAGGTVHDTYLGYVPWAALARLTGVEAGSAYSLTIATLFTLLCLNAWIAGAVLIERFRPRSEGKDDRAADRGAMRYALIAPLLLAGLGSLGFAWRAGSIALDVLATRGPGALIGDRTSGSTVLGLIPSPPWDSVAAFLDRETMTFPLASFLGGDLGPTQLAMPMVVAAIAIVTSFAMTMPGTPDRSGAPMCLFGGWRGALRFAVPMGLLLGFVATTNWLAAIPLLMLVAGLTVLAAGVATEWSESWAIPRDTALLTLIVMVTAGLAFLPFFLGYGRFPRTVEPLPLTRNLGDFLLHFGIPLAIIGACLAALVWNAAASGSIGGRAAMGYAVAAVIVLGLAIVVGNVALFLLIAMVFGAVLLWLHQYEIQKLVILGMVMLALGLGVVADRVQLIAPVGDATIQRQFWTASWILLAIAAAPALMLLISLIAGGSSRRAPALPPFVRNAGLAAIAVLIGIGTIYPVLALPTRLATDGGDPPIWQPGDREAAAWLRESQTGTPTILEAPGEGESEPPGGRISALTGFPTVIGQTSAQLPRRPGMEQLIGRRAGDVREIYMRPVAFSLVEPLVREYGVDLIYVGPVERMTYDPAGLAKFDAAAADGILDVAYRSDSVTVYSVPGR